MTRFDEIKERLEKAKQDGSLTLRVNTFITAGDGRNFLTMALDDMEWLVRKLDKIQAVVNEQAEDEGLWSVPLEGLQRIAEAYLQQELRKLHRVIEENEYVMYSNCNVDSNGS